MDQPLVGFPAPRRTQDLRGERSSRSRSVGEDNLSSRTRQQRRKQRSASGMSTSSPSSSFSYDDYLNGSGSGGTDVFSVKMMSIVLIVGGLFVGAGIMLLDVGGRRDTVEGVGSAVLSTSMVTSDSLSSYYANLDAKRYCSQHSEETDQLHKLERHDFDGQHGDICRASNGEFACPMGCHDPSSGPPYCKDSSKTTTKGTAAPCRVPRHKKDRPFHCDPNGGTRGVCVMASSSPSKTDGLTSHARKGMKGLLSFRRGGMSREKRYRDETCDGACATTPSRKKCQDDWDCSLSGICNVSTGTCQCDPWADGHDCSYLKFQEINPKKLGYLHRKHTSWGGNAIRSKIDHKWHMYVSEIICGQDDIQTERCGLSKWQTQSQVTHVVADEVEGPYERVETVLETEHHNPTVHISPIDNSWNLYSISSFDGPTEVVSSTDEGLSWSKPIIISKEQNPAPLLHEDGTVSLYYRGDDAASSLPADSCSTEFIGMQSCPSRTEKCVYSAATTIVADDGKPHSHSVLDHTAEDPSIFVDHRGNYHMLVNALPYRCTPKYQQGGHAWSRDGKTWSSLRVGAFNTTFVLKEDDNLLPVTCERRERPQMIMDPDQPGLPLALVTAVTGCPRYFGHPYRGGDDSFTLVQLMTK